MKLIKYNIFIFRVFTVISKNMYTIVILDFVLIAFAISRKLSNVYMLLAMAVLKYLTF